MARADGFRTTLAVSGRRVLVVGGGTPALAQVAALRDGGAHVTVVAPRTVQSVSDLADRGVLTWHPRTYASSDLAGHDLAVPATGDPVLDAQVAADAAAAQVWCTVANRRVSPRADPDENVEDRTERGRVVLVGGGPGDPGLITIAGLEAVRSADVVVTDRLAPLGVLQGLEAEIIDVGKIPRGRSTPQEEINRILVEQAKAGRRVVRLKGGDTFVFGRGGEEVEACVAAGVPVDVVPGVTSAIAGPALAGIPVTHRGLSQGFTVVSGHVPPGDPRSTLDWTALARSGTDLVLLMAVATLPAITETLIAEGLDPETPAATVADATLPTQRVVRADLATIAARVATEGIAAPAITVIGKVAGFTPTA
ncbi:uroporphyrinogen-III C-methyltransferase [Mumia zhuanghuii]|uniref:uroporphyrinogen-III C-methyltransferase n=2 Tax=Mumia zhuanghuii TaxID=2585211 RepID=A0A5C4MRS8_9ACTN|nr:uroporphyrinogen-III C-methyltransferase [Mumia zhuanghuii]TNC47196.1 uroporphyrinogen-III C-methyltransferase [Mumia zhuanghuii]